MDLNALILLLARIMMAGLFIWDAWLMATQWAPTLAYMEQFGVPGVLLPAAALFQLLGGLAIVLGVLTRPVALAFVGYSLLTAALFHADASDTGQLLHLGKNVVIAGGFLLLITTGPGAYSIDARRTAKSGG